MTVSRHIIRVLGVISVVALSLFATSRADADSVFNATSAVRQCNALPAGFGEPSLVGNVACADNLTLNAVRDVTLTTDIPAGSVSFANLVSFAPSTAYEAPGGAFAAGATAGGLRYSTTMGVLNGPCTTLLNIDAVLYNVALPDNPTDRRASANIAYPRNQGEVDRFGKWRVGSPPTAFQGQTVIDLNTDGIADANNLSFTNYPSYLLDYFDPDFLPGSDGALKPLVPDALYGGMAFVQNEWMPIYAARFAAGGVTTLPGPFTKMNSNMGQPFVYVIGDPTATQPSVTAISDVCAPASVTTMLLGQIGGVDRGRNPASVQTAYWGSYAASQRDADQDGLENVRDTCPKQVNSGTDADADGIDDACDTVSSGGSDQDGDGFSNRQDNCPQDPNALATQTEAELTVPYATAGADLGPKYDGIGDTCDAGALALSPAPMQNGRPLIGSPGLGTVGFSSTVGNGRYLVRSYFVPKCIGGTDADGDGYCAGMGDSVDAPTGQCPLACAAVRHTSWMMMTHPANQMDTDGDRFSDALESYLSTDATKSCNLDLIINNEGPLDNWPIDMDDNSTATTLDLVGYAQTLNKYLGEVPGAVVRLDWNSDGLLTTLDLVSWSNAQIGGRRCGDFAGPVHPPTPPWIQQ